MKKRLYGIFIALALVFSSTISVYASENEVKTFDVIAEVFDYGESITGLIIDMDEEILSSEVDINTFDVLAHNLKQDDSTYYDGECEIVDVKVANEDKIDAVATDRGRYIIIDLEYGYNNIASNSIYYNLATDDNGEYDFFKSFNLEVKLNYEIIQTKAIGYLTTNTTYQQDDIVRPIVDQFVKKVSSNGLNYREYTPTIKADSYPLIVWFHGSGEGGSNNSSQILANKGGVAFANETTQQIFNGAYVIAPQCPDNWAVGSKDYVPDALALIKETIANHPDIDSNRILIAGCSAGASMTWMTFLAEPDLFAAVVPICGPEIEKAELAKVVDTPIWMIHSKNDGTVPYEYSLNNYNNLVELGGNVHLTSYETVNVDGNEYDGHWAWVYALNNDPKLEDGTSLFEWMAMQSLKAEEIENAPVVDLNNNADSSTDSAVMSPKTGDNANIFAALGLFVVSTSTYLYVKRKYS